MDEMRSQSSLGVEAGFPMPAANSEAQSQLSPAVDAPGGRLLALLSLQVAAFVLLTASGKIPGVVLALFRALLTF